MQHWRKTRVQENFSIEFSVTESTEGGLGGFQDLCTKFKLVFWSISKIHFFSEIPTYTQEYHLYNSPCRCVFTSILTLELFWILVSLSPAEWQIANNTYKMSYALLESSGLAGSLSNICIAFGLVLPVNLEHAGTVMIKMSWKMFSAGFQWNWQEFTKYKSHKQDQKNIWQTEPF